MLEFMRRRYREATGNEPPDDEALVRADAERTPEERQLIRDYIDRCVSEAVANNRQVAAGIQGSITPEALMDRARKITEN